MSDDLTAELIRVSRLLNDPKRSLADQIRDQDQYRELKRAFDFEPEDDLILIEYADGETLEVHPDADRYEATLFEIERMQIVLPTYVESVATLKTSVAELEPLAAKTVYQSEFGRNNANADRTAERNSEAERIGRAVETEIVRLRASGRSEQGITSAARKNVAKARKNAGKVWYTSLTSVKKAHLHWRKLRKGAESGPDPDADE